MQPPLPQQQADAHSPNGSLAAPSPARQCSRLRWSLTFQREGIINTWQNSLPMTQKLLQGPPAGLGPSHNPACGCQERSPAPCLPVSPTPPSYRRVSVLPQSSPDTSHPLGFSMGLYIWALGLSCPLLAQVSPLPGPAKHREGLMSSATPLGTRGHFWTSSQGPPPVCILPLQMPPGALGGPQGAEREVSQALHRLLLLKDLSFFFLLRNRA